ncbi:MAG TPA: ABC transporter ATP-binding protein [Polyangiales bacterium]|nr:ABC transporter ATP-binding protein [Polyangiales bacterium]
MAEALRVERLGVTRGSRALLEDVSLHADYGTLLAITGPNGAGKSTLIKALVGLLPHSGAVRIGDAEVASLTPAERARAVAYIPQRSSIMASVAVRDVVAQARYAHRSRFGRANPTDPAVTRALEQTDLTALSGRAYDTLSGGEQRRVLLARALATEARILLFDEPTSGLDIAHALRFFELADRLRKAGFVLVCVLHELDDALRHADAALLLSEGKSVSFGPVSEVLSAEHIARVYGVRMFERAGLGYALDGEPR